MGVICSVVITLGIPYLFGERFVEEIIIPR